MSRSSSPEDVDTRDGFDEVKKTVDALWSKDKEMRKIVRRLEEREERSTKEMKRKCEVWERDLRRERDINDYLKGNFSR